MGKDDISVPISGDLDYSLYVQAFSGTQFECTILNKENDKTIIFSGVPEERF